MTSSTTPPEGDGLDGLFTEAGFTWNVTPAAQEPQQFASRREARESLARTSHPRRMRAAKPSPVVPRPDSAYPDNRVLVVVRQPPVRKRKRGHNLLTALVVVGLFGSVSLPAVALSPQVTGDTAVVSTEPGLAALSVSKDATIAASPRAEFSATTASDLRSQRSTARKAANFEAYFKSGARDLGDDYPWFSELSNNQGGGLSPLNYFYRECVDFVAWRLNRDAGSYTAPFLYDWSYLTPSGGNASQWKYAWRNHGWPTSTTPIAGSVAYFTGNHVAYVKQVNPDGTVLLEEYNYQSDHLYGQRTIPATDVELFLYPPPR